MGSNSSRRGLLADINVTPLVDVMLVLLIIFMITAPMMTTGLEVDLPKTKAGQLKAEKPLLITINAEGKIFINQQEFPLERLDIWLKEARKGGWLKGVTLKADRRCPYGIVAKVLAEIQAVGITEVGLVTEPENHVP